MFARHTALTLAALLLAGACSDGTAPPPARGDGPHFLRWEGGVAPHFTATGALAQTADALGGVGVGGMSFAVTGDPQPITVDHSSSATASTASLSWAHQVGDGANRLLVVGVSIRNGGKTVTGVTYGTQALRFLSAKNNHDNAVRVEMWYLPAPPIGSANVTVTLSGGTKVVGGAVSFTGVDPVSPFGSLATGGSTGTGDTHPTIVGIPSAADELIVAAVATEGDATTMTPEGDGQTERWSRFYGTSGGDVWGAGSTQPGAASATARWKTKSVKWAVSAVALQRPVYQGLNLTTHQVSFWAVRGQQRSVAIDYQSATGAPAAPFLRLTTYDPTYVPGRGYLAAGDSVLVTVTVDPVDIAVQLEPSGTQFGQATQLKLYYGGAGGDLNGDGVVDSTDSYIEDQLLGMWYQEGSNPWTQIAATKSVTDKSIASALQHFSGYAVSW